MPEIDPSTIGPRMSRIERLMTDLETLALSKGVSIASEKNHIGTVAADARQLICWLLKVDEKSPGEQIYRTIMAQAKYNCGGENAPPSLEDALRFVRRWTEDTFPASDKGQIHFGRALIEALADAAEAHLKREKPDG